MDYQVRKAAARLLVACGLVLAVCLVSGWSNGANGGDSFGTHDWALYQANRVARDSGVSWLDWPLAQAATDDPDTVLHDTYHHVYDVWGKPWGDAPTRVQELYDETVRELKAGDREAASVSFGLLSHYFSDVSNPLHTDQCPQEEGIHSRYELDAQALTSSVNQNRDWITPEALTRRPSAKALTEQVADESHASYDTLVSDYAANGMDERAVSITRTALDRAADGLADLLYSAACDASVAAPAVTPKPAAPATAVARDSAASETATIGPGGDNTSVARTTRSTLAAASPGTPVQGGAAGPDVALVFVGSLGAAFLAALAGALGRATG